MSRPRSLRLRLVSFSFGLLAPGLAFADAAPDAKSSASAITLSPAATQGVWEGWGTSLCWWAKVFGGRDDVADLLFTVRQVNIEGESLPGLGMTIARYNAGACSWNEIDGRRMVVSKIIRPFRQIESFWLDGKNPDPDSAGWDWSVDANQRAALLKARDRGADRFELFSNSPPWWMCVNDNPSGADKAEHDNLRPDQHANFARYLAAVARRARDHWGVAFTTVDPFNEPYSNYWFANGKQEGCHFERATQIAFLPLFRAELDRQGLSELPISASDETSYDHAVDSWKAFPPETKALVAQVNVHGYQGGGGRRDLLHQMVVEEDGKRLWNSEYGDKNASGLGMARNLHLDFHWLRPTAWCYWQPFDGGEKGAWGLLPADLDRATIGRANPKYFVFAQYSRHIRPGMTILRTGDARTAAAYDAKAGRLVVVAFNDSKDAAAVHLDLSAFKSARGARVSRWMTEPNGKSRYQRMVDETLREATPSWKLPAEAIVTFEIEGVRS